MHDCQAVHLSTVPIKETFNGKTVWEGEGEVEVEIFNIFGHPETSQCYAWAYQDSDGKTQYTAVLKLPPVKNAQDAVKAALVAQVRNERKET
jgi:hypothetical protein